MARHARKSWLGTLLIAALLGLLIWFPLGVTVGYFAHAPHPQPAATAPTRPGPSAVPTTPAPPPPSTHPQPRPPQQPQVRYYTVQPGDSLWSIARDKYGDAHLWPKLWHLNQEDVPNPHLIHPGDVLRY